MNWVSRGTLRAGYPIRYGGVSILATDDASVRGFRTYYDSAAFARPLAPGSTGCRRAPLIPGLLFIAPRLSSARCRGFRIDGPTARALSTGHEAASDVRLSSHVAVLFGRPS